MKKKVYLLIVVVLLVASLSISLFACKKDEKLDYASLKVAYASTFKEVKLATTDKSWRDGMVGGNGITGFITNGPFLIIHSLNLFFSYLFFILFLESMPYASCNTYR